MAAHLPSVVRVAGRPALPWPDSLPGEARLGVLILPEQCGPKAAETWQRAEQAGFAHAWTFDHLAWRGRPAGSWFDALTTLAAAAAVTRTIPLGPLVSTPNFRHPVTLAKQAMTLDHISGGRLVLGLGAGASGPDTTALGGPPLSAGERASRFEEFTELTHRLLCEHSTTYRGQFFQATEVPMIPGCLQEPRVPLAIAAPGSGSMQVAARHADIWVCNGPVGDPGAHSEQQAFADLARQLGQLSDACAAVGRDFAALHKLVYVSRFVPDACESPGRMTDVLGRCAALGCTDVVVAYPRATGPLAGQVDALEQVAAGSARPHKRDATLVTE